MTHSRKPSNDLNILGIDPGTNCGWSYRDANGNHTSGVWCLKPKNASEPVGVRFVKLRCSIESAIEAFNIDRVAYEESVNNTGAKSGMVQGGIVATLALCCEDHGLPYESIHWGTVKKAATGKGNANKTAMVVAACRKWPGFEPTDDNEADARWIAECAAAGLNGGKEAG